LSGRTSYQEQNSALKAKKAPIERVLFVIYINRFYRYDNKKQQLDYKKPARRGRNNDKKIALCEKQNHARS
jgi:hypothetical protein